MSDLPAFREALPVGTALTDEGLIAERYGRNITALRRSIPIVLLPETTDEVRRIVQIANEYRVPLYPISTGRNWGLGSKLPVRDGCAVLDLSRLNRIVEVREDTCHAAIEPGVTQAQLAAHLNRHHPGLTLNFTGSFAHSSIMGNVLERGDGLRARVHDLLGVEGILGSGEPFTAGCASRYSAGPDLAGLFCQSNFGIVTKMLFRLIRRPERRYLFWAIAPDAELHRMADTFQRLADQNVVRADSVNIGYANRFVQSLLPHDGVWNAYAVVDGPVRVADAQVEEMRQAFLPFCPDVGACHAQSAEDLKSILPPFLHPLISQLGCEPDDSILPMIYRLTGTPAPTDPRAFDADLTPFGMKCYVGLIPPGGPSARRTADIVAGVRERSGLNIKASFFGDGRTLITIHFFTNDSEAVTRAEAAESDLWDRMTGAGFYPYRASIDQMERLLRLRPEGFRIAGQLKMLWDPNGIIAPGRYCDT